MATDNKDGAQPPDVTPSVNPEFAQINNDLKYIFGEKARITITPYPENSPHRLHIAVSSTLEPSQYLEGGQELLVITHEPTTITLNSPRGTEDITGYLVEHISVNRHSQLFDNFSSIFLAEAYTARGSYAWHTIEAIEGAENRVSVIPQLITADNIATLLHEQGHQDTTTSELAREYMQTMLKVVDQDEAMLYQNPENIAEEDRKAIVDRWLFILSLEYQANRAVFKRVNSPKDAKTWAGIFPRTSSGHYYYLERTLFEHMATYIDAFKGWCFRNMDEEQRERYRQMLDINPNITGEQRFIPFNF